MKDCSEDIKDYHDDEVVIDSATRKKMRDHRNANRDRLKRGLEAKKKPKPDESIIQGSYAMKTMTQHKENDYDIDDGATFDDNKLKKDNGTAMTPREAREMVRDALEEGGGLPTAPTAEKKCVRVEYAGGYHVDIPVYRRILNSLGEVIRYEIACEDNWKESNPRDINDWFQDAETRTKVPDEDEPQLRRLVRLLKAYSRAHLGKKSPSGLILTILAQEVHGFHEPRDDRAFRNLVSNIKVRIQTNRQVRNPAKPAEILTSAKDDSKFDALIEKIGESLDSLKVLDLPNCSMTDARRAWDKAFKTDYFSKLQKVDEDAAKGPYTPSATEPEKKAYIRGPGTAA